MKNSKFAEAYLNIIKEENEQFAATDASTEAPSAPETTAEGAPAEGAEVKPVQCVCFKTSDQALIDAIKSGFDEVVFFVKAKDEATGEDTIAEVKFGANAFEDFEVKPIEAEETAAEDESCPECGSEPCVCGEGEEVATECGDGATTEGDGEAITTEDEEIEEEIDPSEWLEDGVCVKCGKSDCDGSCKCEKCGSQNCIGDCDEGVTTECGDAETAVTTEEDEGGDAVEEAPAE